MDGNIFESRKEKVADLKISGYTWTWPKLDKRVSGHFVTLIKIGMRVLGHLRVHVCLLFKASLTATFFLMKIKFHSYLKKN